MTAILQHRSTESTPNSKFYLFQFPNDKTKDVDHEYTGSHSRAYYKGFPWHQRGRISNQIIYSGEIT